MELYAAALLAGAVLGFASSLHCGAMCGAICAGTLTRLNPHTGARRAEQLVMTQAGRITTYVILGVIVGAATAPLAPSVGAYSLKLLQWAAAASLMWVGLSVAGVMPESRRLDRLVLSLGRRFEASTSCLRCHQRVAPYMFGVVWGLSACPVLYGALFSATLTGSPVVGGIYMLGFGLATTPAVATSAWAISGLGTVREPSSKVFAGLLIVAAGVLSIYAPWPEFLGMCLTTMK